LIATDIAARGIDIDELTHVINYEIPNIPETYVHRIGRTGRAGADGIAFSFCDEEEIEYLKDIHKLIGKPIPVTEAHPYPMSPSLIAKKSEPAKNSSGSNHRHPRSSGHRDGQKRFGGNRSGGNRR
jgi:ATP-dependent RNA helicase RhlE